jgi:hypothetical protein
MDQWKVMNNTGWLTPCSYTEYKLAAEPLKSEKRNPGLRLMLATSLVKSNQEGLAYPWVSVVAELGGSLGLFLGFSFNMISDAVEFLIYYLNQAPGPGHPQSTPKRTPCPSSCSCRSLSTTTPYPPRTPSLQA